MKSVKSHLWTPKPLLMCLTVLLSNTAYATSWVSTPSVMTVGNDIEINGGGAPNSSPILIKALNKEGEIVFQANVVSSSDGTFYYTTAIEVTGELTVVASMNNLEASSTSLVMEND